MGRETGGSVTIWIGDLKVGGDAGAQPLWERYFERLVFVARAKLRAASPNGIVADEEDAALSALDSLFRGIERDRFPKLDDRDDLWRLLVVITKRKVLDQVRYGRTLGRGSGQVIREVDLFGEVETGAGLDQVIDPEPTPEFAVMLAEEAQRRLASLGDPKLQEVVVLKMEGFTNDEIADKLKSSRSSVQRKLDVIRNEWRES